MSRETIRNRQSVMIGVIETDAQGKQIARNTKFTRLGEYDPRSDKTRDANYRLLGTGNLLAALIWDAAG
jgi:hypothetical protein